MTKRKEPEMATPTESLLAVRGSVHGNWIEQSMIAQYLKDVMRGSPGWQNLHQYQRESLEMIAVKMSRAVAGDPNHKDHWDDIAGYATLVSKNIKASEEAQPSEG